MGFQRESPALGWKRWPQDTTAKVIRSSLFPTQGPVPFKGRVLGTNVTLRDRKTVIAENVISQFHHSEDHVMSLEAVKGKCIKGLFV